MAGSQRYDLIDEIPGGVTESFRARTASGREVTVHFLRGGRTPENEALLARLRAIPPAAQANLVEVGEYEGTPFVVTAAPPYQHLAAWIKDQEPHASAGPQKFTRVGMWKVPDFTAGEHPPAPPPPPPVEPLPPPAGGDDFLTLFQPGSGPKSAPPPPVTPPAAGAGEFTRMFQASAPPEPPPPMPVAQVPPPASGAATGRCPCRRVHPYVSGFSAAGASTTHARCTGTASASGTATGCCPSGGVHADVPADGAASAPRAGPGRASRSTAARRKLLQRLPASSRACSWRRIPQPRLRPRYRPRPCHNHRPRPASHPTRRRQWKCPRRSCRRPAPLLPVSSPGRSRRSRRHRLRSPNHRRQPLRASSRECSRHLRRHPSRLRQARPPASSRGCSRRPRHRRRPFRRGRPYPCRRLRLRPPSLREPPVQASSRGCSPRRFRPNRDRPTGPRRPRPPPQTGGVHADVPESAGRAVHVHRNLRREASSASSSTIGSRRPPRLRRDSPSKAEGTRRCSRRPRPLRPGLADPPPGRPMSSLRRRLPSVEGMQGPSEYTRMISRPPGMPGAGPGAPPAGDSRRNGYARHAPGPADPPRSRNAVVQRAASSASAAAPADAGSTASSEGTRGSGAQGPHQQYDADRFDLRACRGGRGLLCYF